MKLNTKVRYGLRSMLELAMNGDSTGLLQKEIAERQEIPIKYLDKIIADLKSSGLIINVAGKRSGYILSDSAHNITVYDIFKAFEGDLAILQCLTPHSTCTKTDKCSSQLFWGDLNQVMIDTLQNKTLAELAEEQKTINNKTNMFTYDI